jgi:hypothetical protein
VACVGAIIKLLVFARDMDLSFVSFTLIAYHTQTSLKRKLVITNSNFSINSHTSTKKGIQHNTIRSQHHRDGPENTPHGRHVRSRVEANVHPQSFKRARFFRRDRHQATWIVEDKIGAFVRHQDSSSEDTPRPRRGTCSTPRRSNACRSLQLSSIWPTSCFRRGIAETRCMQSLVGLGCPDPAYPRLRLIDPSTRPHADHQRALPMSRSVPRARDADCP